MPFPCYTSINQLELLKGSALVMAKLLMKLWQRPYEQFNHVLDKCTCFNMFYIEQPIRPFINGLGRYTDLRLSVIKT